MSFKSPTGITHGVEVEAETLYEAAGLRLARLKKDGWIEGLGPGSRLEIQVREPSTISQPPYGLLLRVVILITGLRRLALQRYNMGVDFPGVSVM